MSRFSVIQPLAFMSTNFNNNFLLYDKFYIDFAQLEDNFSLYEEFYNDRSILEFRRKITNLEFLMKEGYVEELTSQFNHSNLDFKRPDIIQENEFATAMLMKLGYPKLMDWINLREGLNGRPSKMQEGLSNVIDGLAEFNKERGVSKKGLRKHFGLMFLFTYEYVITQLQAIFMSSEDTLNFYVPMVPEVDSGDLFNELGNESQADIVKVLLHHFPTIDEGTSLEELIKFKESSVTRLQLAKMRVWMNNLSKGDLNYKEINELVESSLQEYSLSLKANNMQFGLMVVQLLFTLSQVSTVAGAFVSKYSIIEAVKSKQALTLSASKAPGAELAFINSVNAKFGVKK